jgi:bile acid:Na+ symporter, BASS family
MFLMDPLTKALSYVFLAGSMLGIGLKIGKDEFLTVVRDRSWLLRMAIANFVLIPAVGILAARLLPMKPENGLALIVLACAPGGMSALQYLSKKKESAALAYGGGTTVLLTFLSIFISPALIALAIPKGMTLTVPYGRAVLFVALFMLLPLVLGMLVHGLAGPAAHKVAGPVALIATLAFVGAMVKMLNVTKWAKGEMGKTGLLAIIAFILVSMLIGWLLGGPRKFTRPVLATVSSMRNIALALAIAIRSFDDPAVMTPLVAFMAIMISANLLFMLISRVAGKKPAKRAAAA